MGKNRNVGQSSRLMTYLQQKLIGERGFCKPFGMKILQKNYR